MTSIKIAVRDDVDTNPINNYTTIINHTNHVNFNIYSIQLKTVSVIELVSFLLSDYKYYICCYEFSNKVPYNFESLCIFYKNILAVVEHSKQMVSLIIDVSNFKSQNIQQIKLLYSYCFTFFMQNPGTQIIASDVSFTDNLSNLLFFYNKLKANNHPIELYTTHTNHQIIYTYNDAAQILNALHKLKEEYSIVFPLKNIGILGSSFGFYLQNTGFDIVYKDNLYLAINKKNKTTLDREYIIKENEITFVNTIPLTDINILSDAIEISKGFNIKIPFQTTRDIYILSRSLFEIGNSNVIVGFEDGFVKTFIVLYNYKLLLKTLDTIKSRLNTVSTTFNIKEYSTVETILNTENYVETFYILNLIYGDKFAYYKNAANFEFIIYDTSIPLINIPKLIEEYTFPSVSLQDENDVEPITTDKYNELQPYKRCMLIPFKNTWYLLGSLLEYIERETSGNILPRHPLTRELLSRKELNYIYSEFNRLLNMKRCIPDFNHYSELFVEKDGDDWVHVYIIHQSEKYTVVYLPVFPSETVMFPIQKIITFIKTVHQHDLLIDPCFDMRYSIRNTIIYNPCIDFFMIGDSKDNWPNTTYKKIDLYNELCRTISVYL